MQDHPSNKLPADKRARLFHVSSGEFAANGFSQASLNRIISQVGMSKSSFYHYFSNKADLFEQTFHTVLGPIIELQQEIVIDALTAETLWPTLMGLAGKAMGLVDASPDMIIAGRMFYSCYEDREGRVLTQGILEEFTDWIAKLLRRGQELGLFRDDLPESLLLDMLVALGMSMDRWMLENWDNLTDKERLALSQTSFDLVLRILNPVNPRT